MHSTASHLFMLADRRRMTAYDEAIRKTVRPGDRVVDVGTGSGVLAFLALRAGAAHVDAIELRATIDVARANARALGLSDRIAFHRRRADRVRLRPRADVVVTETMGMLGFDESLLEIARHARRALARPGARWIPRAIEWRVEPVEWPVAWRRFEALRDVRGLDLAVNREMALNVPSTGAYPPPGPWLALAGDASMFRCRLADPACPTLPLQGRATWRVMRSGALHGVRMRFRADLAPGVSLESGPPTHWGAPLFPTLEPVRVRPGDRVEWQAWIDESYRCTWETLVTRRGRRLARFSQSHIYGDPKTRRQLATLKKSMVRP